MQTIAIIIAAISLAFSIISLVISFFAIPQVFRVILEKKSKDLSTHTVVPGQLFDMMEKNPDFMPSANDIEFPKEAERVEKKKNRYG